jgi:excisionase family DNA binding protein
MQDDLVTLQRAAELLDVHYMTVYRYVRTGRLEAEKVGTEWRVHHDVLTQFSAARTNSAAEPPTAPVRAADLVQRLVKRVIAADEAGAWSVIEDALTSGHQISTLYVELLAPAMETVGADWANGNLSIAEEHLASATMTRLMSRLSPRLNRRGRKRGTVVVGAPEGDMHHLPSQFVTDLLRGAGFNPLGLGANTPASAFVFAASAHPSTIAIVISLAAPDHELALAEVIREIRRDVPKMPIAIGGSAVDNELASAVRADYWSHDVGSLINWLTGLDDAKTDASN